MFKVEKTGGENENEVMEIDDGSYDKQMELFF